MPKLHNGSFRSILLNGLVFGVVAYGTYNLTNMAALKGWSVNVVIVDMIWGGILTGVSAVLSTFVVRWILKIK
jgi:uncharacterized membrane protein